MLLIRSSFCWTRAFNEEDNNLCFENCASTFLKKVYEFVNAQVDWYDRVGTGQLPSASSGMRDILIRASRYKMSRPLRNALGSCPVPTLRTRTPGTALKHILGADKKFVARLCRAFIWGGRSQSSGLANFLIRLSERSRNRTPPAELPQGPPWCCFSEHSAGRRKPRSA